MAGLSRRQFVGALGIGVAGAALTRETQQASAASTDVRIQPEQVPAGAPKTWSVTVGVESSDMAVQGMVFFPTEIWINVGDTVTWNLRSTEFHTVTFLPPRTPQLPFDQTNPLHTQPQGGSHYDGVGYYNSGLLFKGQSYSLTFDVPGDFTYVCLVHATQKALVHVREAGTTYPYSQRSYDMIAELQTAEILRHGAALAVQGAVYAGPNPLQGNHVVAGIGDGPVMLARFYPETILVRVGDTVVFTNLDVEAPHTVTFGEVTGDIFAPYGDPTSYGGGPLNSGFIGMNPFWFGNTFRVRFTTAGTYPYVCVPHVDMGMRGTVIVVPGRGRS